MDAPISYHVLYCIKGWPHRSRPLIALHRAPSILYSILIVHNTRVHFTTWASRRMSRRSRCTCAARASHDCGLERRFSLWIFQTSVQPNGPQARGSCMATTLRAQRHSERTRTPPIISSSRGSWNHQRGLPSSRREQMPLKKQVLLCVHRVQHPCGRGERYVRLPVLYDAAERLGAALPALVHGRAQVCDLCTYLSNSTSAVLVPLKRGLPVRNAAGP